ncbi:FAD-dependent oxidoreductase [Hymenobacter properus]|uniref:Flavin-dependent monooxygenase n=1 Tax=Hymenobacter properus TaxID=2791026 RepID=A0A931BE10_9BACT|nr:NAD(P)/FAD-dependent oxidoreductase [Hymenobacter properus]MBF9142089.1 FAD-dependent monooxygenase [Hymenobacter properus]MBR7720896.1 FAD-dependent monooxygenase [Microvirga sp. SRT04]
MLLQNKQVAIVGGGPGGLTLARLLQQQGAAVRVYERDRSRRERVQGGTLDLHDESGLAALRTAGLLDAFRAHYRPGADRLRLTDKHATVALDQHADASADTFGDAAFRPEIDRGPLRHILLDSLQPGTVVWDSQLVAVQPLGAGWQLTFQGGATATADILIGADGANSKIRPLLTPIRPFYSGVTIVEGTVYDSVQNAPQLHALTKGGKIFALDDAKTLVVSAKGDGSLTFYTGCKMPETWARDSGIDFADAAEVRAWFRQEFAGWDKIWEELFASETTRCVPRPQYCMPLDQTWPAQPNLTLLGDAAHLMPPYAGEGVNMAMLDALELSECLTCEQFPTVQAAIAHYEQHMRQRASAVAQETLEQTERLHAPGALGYLVELFGAPHGSML